MDKDIADRLAALESEVARQRDLLEIQDVLTRYSRALDWLDDAMLDTVFYDDAEIDYGFFQGSGCKFKQRLMALEHGVPRRWHFTSQVKIDLAGDWADVESYNLSLALSSVEPKPNGTYAAFFGLYEDRFEKRNGNWGIIARKHLLVSGAPLTELALSGDLGKLNQIGPTCPAHPDFRRLSHAEPLENS